MSSRNRSSQNLTGSSNKIRLNSINKVFKLDSAKSKKQRQETLVKNVSQVVIAELLRDGKTTHNRVPDLKSFLADKENLDVFREFLKSQYCEENLDFYLLCDRYKSLKFDNVGYELVKLMATQIYNDFLSKTARQPVNIDHTYVEKIESCLKTPMPNLFDEAQVEILHLMEADCYPRFCKTWQLDKNLARKIVAKANQNIPHINDVTTHSTPRFTGCKPLKSTLDDTKSSISSTSRYSSRESSSISNEKSCSSNCLHKKCTTQQHLRSIAASDSLQVGRQFDFNAHTDLRMIHKLPESLRPRRTPPPPPVPPRAPLNLVGNERRNRPAEERDYPFVGKVFYV